MWFGDLEADGLLDYATRVWCGVFKNSETKEIKKFLPHQIEDMLKFLDTTERLVIHNGISYDLPLLEKLYGYVYPGEIVDTLIISRLNNPKRFSPPHCPNKKNPHSIEAWGYRVGRGKVEHEDWSKFSEEMLHRCTEDVEILELTYYELMKEGEIYNWDHAYKLTFQLFKILRKQEQYGWLVDKEYINRNINLLTKWMRWITTAVDSHIPNILVIQETKKGDEYSYVKKPFLKSGKLNNNVCNWMASVGYHNIRGPFSRVLFRKISLDSHVEIKDFLLSQGWIPSDWNTDDAGEKTSPKLSKSDQFEGIDGKVGRLIAKYIQCKHRRASLEGLLKHIREDGRIPSIVTGIANTGRAKHSVIVNIPGADSFFGKQMRKCFICKDNYVIVGCDSAGCQNRMLAARVDDPNFTQILLHGKKEDKTSIHFVNQKAIKDVANYDVSYSKAKNLNYAFMFGASNKKLGSIIGEDSVAGEKIREALLSISPGFAKLVEELTYTWRSNAKKRNNRWGNVEYYDGWIPGLDGRPIFIESEHTILVYMLQSDEAIMMTAAYCFLYKWAENRGWKFGEDWGYLIWMHDEYQCEVKEEIAEEFSKLAELAIVKAGEYFKIKCPHEGESRIGKNWYETH